MVPKALGHFAVLEKIGQGGMGEVYRARDTKLERPVAIKVLPALKVSDAERQRRFIKEAKAASALNHPNIITVYEILADGAASCIVMEYVDGHSLDQLIPRRKGMRLQDLLRAGIQIADALVCAHGAGIIHRDLKPANIMVREDGVVKVLDFGLAKLLESSGSTDAEATRTVSDTEEGAIVGTLGYMSPEQVESKKVDARSDIFSFGAVLYEMATGRRAFEGDSRVSTMSAILRDDPKWPADDSDYLPPEFKRIVNRCLRKDPERRFQTIKDVKIALDEIREDSESGRLSPPNGKPKRRKRALLLGGLTGVLVAGIVGFAAWRMLPSPRSQQPSLRMRPLTEGRGSANLPTLSPDGKLVAYASDRAGDGGLDIWVQQLASGASPIRLTRDSAEELFPRFSPDGSHLAFQSTKDGGGLYIIPSLGGEQRLILAGSFSQSDFSPDGKWLAVGPDTRPSTNAFIVGVAGGAARPIAHGFHEVRSPVWSPDGKYIVFTGISAKSESDWWIVPAEGGTPARLGFDFGEDFRLGPRQWLDDFLLFSNGDIARVRIKANPWRLEGPVEALTSGPALELSPHAIRHPADRGRWMVAFATGEQEPELWELPMDYRRGRAASNGARKFLEQPRSSTPSISADGKRLAYVRNGLEGVELHARDLTTGSDRILARTESTPRARLSPDGATIAVNPRYAVEQEQVIDLVSWSTGQTRRLCGDCGLIYEWSAAGKLLYRSGKPMRFWTIDVRTGRRHTIASDPKLALGGMMPSPDGRWIALHYAVSENIRPIYIAPVRDGVPGPREEWIPLMDRPGSHVRPWWSPDGRFLYFVSNASGREAVWGQAFNAGAKTLTGEPFRVFTPPMDRLFISPSPLFGPALTRSSIIFTMSETTSNVWLGE